MTSASSQTGAGDFDFFIGKWRVAHRRLKERLVGCNDWVTFGGTAVTQKILGGLGNIDDNKLEFPGDPYFAITLRTFDTKTARWSIWWLDGRNPGSLETPMVGHFEDGVGAFYANDTLAGRPILVRFLWTIPTPDSPHWEQAFSPDGGTTWETNWTMNFTRQA